MLLIIFLASLTLVRGHSPEMLLVPRDTTVPLNVPMKIWAKTRQAVLRPTAKDLRIDNLISLIGSHFDPDWMSITRPAGPPMDPGIWNRTAVRRLRQMADGLPLRDSLKEWLISRATCPVKYVWKDLGIEFWPRWVRIAECPDHPTGACSWPPGMKCVPAPPKHLHVLKWHCRLRKNAKKHKKHTTENNVFISTMESPTKPPKGNKKKRKRYRCTWITVPYPVTEDCQCGCDLTSY